MAMNNFVFHFQRQHPSKYVYIVINMAKIYNMLIKTSMDRMNMTENEINSLNLQYSQIDREGVSQAGDIDGL